ncbi:hypothetical protein [Kineococcus sp. SYSU DK001]|uniref:hypothetical protein n=1 Tax=Kineococcus sp. SYSU DK001 TaxID=3383122 RepID=UPI003D7EFF88
MLSLAAGDFTDLSMTTCALRRWHAVVNTRDTRQAPEVVTDPVLVHGPKGAGRISTAQFADWIEHSAITLTAHTWHPVSERVSVVEQHATWPQDPSGTEVATCFITSAGRVSAALRYPPAREALQLAHLLSEVFAVETVTSTEERTTVAGTSTTSAGTRKDARA